MQREQRDDDAAWQAIIDNYGDRVLDPADDLTDQPAAEPTDPHDSSAPDGPTAAEEPSRYLGTPDEDTGPEVVDPWDEFVPPTPPPLPRPTPDRLLSWIGVLGAPAVLLVVVVTGIHLPALIGWLLVASFVAGFGYLVMTMSSEPRDPWDDGAQL